MKFDHETKRVVMQRPHVVKALRAEYRQQNIRQDFKEYAVKQLMREARQSPTEHVLPCYIEDMKVHHIVPLFLGGDNSFENLALVRESIHKRLHEVIDRQIVGMRPDDARWIKIPMLTGNVWG